MAITNQEEQESTGDKIKNSIIKPRIHHGKNIAKLRDMYGYTYTRLAEILGWRQQKVSDIEDMEEIPDDIIIEIAGAFGVSPSKIKYNNIHEEAIKVFKADNISAGGMMYDKGEQQQTFYSDTPQNIEKLTNYADKLILQEKELRQKDQEVFKAELQIRETQLEYEKKAHDLTKRELEILKQEMALLKQG